jgi:cholest-4-en-3-one 26-monooxygenase
LLRVATKDLDLDGKEVRQGDWVFACLAAGNNDDRVFDDPSRFDVTRPRLSEHLGLGDGIHKCLGRNMVRLEVAILAQTLLTALPELTVLSEPRWLTDVSRSGLTALSMSTHA